jgi:CRISPR/Cas system CSM-associated protein Csm4 (group 5 of RAMP superfamily)
MKLVLRQIQNVENDTFSVSSKLFGLQEAVYVPPPTKPRVFCKIQLFGTNEAVVYVGSES